MTLSRRSQAALAGRAQMPGDKSISHRALILAALASGPSTVSGANLGDDVRATARILGQLGAGCTIDSVNNQVQVQGCGWGGLHESDGILDAGNSGTTVRLLLGVCAGVDGASILTGDDSLRRRPMLRIVAPLRQMGARIDGRRDGDRAPLLVRGGPLEGLEYESPVASAQIKSALLLAGLNASGATTITEPQPSRDHTERMLAAAGVHVDRAGSTVTVPGGSDISPIDRAVPGDVSAAMFFVIAAVIVPGSDLTIEAVGLNPTRTGALEVLRRMGASIEIEPIDTRSGEPVGNVRASYSELSAIEVGPDEIATLIDEIPALAVAATQAVGTTEIRGAAELRVKESDRIAALVEGLKGLGADADELDDGLVIRGPAALGGGEVRSRGDHRIAMAFAVAGLVAAGPVRVSNWNCVDTSFPGFLDELAKTRESS